jgi:hypothetical protein
MLREFRQDALWGALHGHYEALLARHLPARVPESAMRHSPYPGSEHLT